MAGCPHIPRASHECETTDVSLGRVLRVGTRFWIRLHAFLLPTPWPTLLHRSAVVAHARRSQIDWLAGPPAAGRIRPMSRWRRSLGLVDPKARHLRRPERLDLPGHEVLVEVPSAALLFQAWEERSLEEQQKLREIPPEPFYLRAPHITQPRRGSGPEPDRSH